MLLLAIYLLTIGSLTGISILNLYHDAKFPVRPYQRRVSKFKVVG